MAFLAIANLVSVNGKSVKISSFDKKTYVVVHIRYVAYVQRKNNLYHKFEYMFQVHQTSSKIHTVRKNDLQKYRIQRKTSLENARQEK